MALPKVSLNLDLAFDDRDRWLWDWALYQLDGHLVPSVLLLAQPAKES
jgi:hypothetical protein